MKPNFDGNAKWRFINKKLKNDAGQVFDISLGEGRLIAASTLFGPSFGAALISSSDTPNKPSQQWHLEYT